MAAEAVSAEVQEILENLQGLRKKLQEVKADPKKFSYEDVHHVQQMLDAIDAKRGPDGIFGGSLEGGQVPAGQAACREVMDEAYDLVGELVPQLSDMSPEVKHIHDTLSGIKRKLLLMRNNRDFTSDSVHHYQLMVDAIDNKRVDGIFAGDLQHVPAGQAQCADLLNQCYDILQQMLGVAPDMNADMRGIFHTLIGIKKRLGEMKRHKVTHSSGDLHIFQVQLDAIDNNRKDGIFAGSAQTEIPAGQAVCATLLEQCYKLVGDLQETATDA